MCWGGILAFKFVALILECTEGVGMAVGADEVAAACAGRRRPFRRDTRVVCGAHLTLLVQDVRKVFWNF